MAFGWKKKADHLRMTILSAGHQPATELSPDVAQILELFRAAGQTGDTSLLQVEVDRPLPTGATKLLWEPTEIYGWKIAATMYRQEGQLWWLARAVRRNEQEPSDKDILFLDKVLDHLGAQPKRDMIIGPTSSPPGHERLPFGWWTWKNRAPLFEVQVNKRKKGLAMMRIVPLGTRPSDGYESIDLTRSSVDAEDAP